LGSISVVVLVVMGAGRQVLGWHDMVLLLV
jgi:hypothetical protein